MLRSSIFVTGAAVLALLVFVTGAAGGEAASQRPVTRAATPAAFPVTITTAAGKVTIRKRPARIVSLSPTATESLFAIGAGPQVVAVDDQSDYPKSAPKTTLSGFTPNVEAIAAYRPDLVIASYDPKALVSALGRLGIPVILHAPATTFKGAYQQIRQLGLVTGREVGAVRVITRMKKQIVKILSTARSRASGLSVYHEISPDFYSATTKSFVGKVYAALGLENIADAADSAGTGFPQLSAEYIVASSPDLIVLADTVCCGQKPSTVASRPGWDRISAVRTGSIVRIHDSIASRWGPRLVSFFRAMSSALARL
ncbi:MAG: ABC transporter substrate-binding protein [Actinomycetota bacterium]|nr:ABC transporter substrate-binding protein [Actinomycetota bacterium]